MLKSKHIGRACQERAKDRLSEASFVARERAAAGFARVAPGATNRAERLSWLLVFRDETLGSEEVWGYAAIRSHLLRLTRTERPPLSARRK
jgi:hypothetical protein